MKGRNDEIIFNFCASTQFFQICFTWYYTIRYATLWTILASLYHDRQWFVILFVILLKYISIIWSIFQLIYVTTYLACFRPIFVYFLSSCRTLLYTFAIEDLIVILLIDSSYSIGGKSLHQALLLLDATPSFILKIK